MFSQQVSGRLGMCATPLRWIGRAGQEQRCRPRRGIASQDRAMARVGVEHGVGLGLGLVFDLDLVARWLAARRGARCWGAGRGRKGHPHPPDRAGPMSCLFYMHPPNHQNSQRDSGLAVRQESRRGPKSRGICRSPGWGPSSLGTVGVSRMRYNREEPGCNPAPHLTRNLCWRPRCPLT